MVVMGDDGGGGGGGGETVEWLVANQRGQLGLASLTFCGKFFNTQLTSTCMSGGCSYRYLTTTRGGDFK